MAIPELPPLATADDVITALGLSSPSQLPTTMSIRMAPTLSKVSRRFRKEAQRIFTPGVYTHEFIIHAGAVRLMEVPNVIAKVRVSGIRSLDYWAWQEGGDAWTAWEEGSDIEDLDYPLPSIPSQATALNPLEWFVDGQFLRWRNADFWNLNGRRAEVGYGWNTPVPSDVTAMVADITARNLVVDPLGAVRQSKLLMSRHFRQEVADWVMSGGCGFTKDDIEQAQAYRWPAPPTIIANLKQFDISPSSAFLSDSSW